MFINNPQTPVGLTEILVKSLQVFRANFKTIAIIALIINIPINLAVFIMPSSTLESLLTQTYDINNFKYGFIFLGIQLFFAPISTMAIAYLTRESTENKKIDAVSALNASFFKWFSMASASLIFTAIIVASSLLIVLPIYFINVYSFYMFAVILSGKSGYQALKHSKSLVYGRWFKVLLYWIVLYLLNQFLVFIISFAFAGFADNLVTQMICGSILSVFGSYFVCVQAVWFISLEKSCQAV